MVKKIFVYSLLGIGIIVSSAIGAIIGTALLFKVMVQPMISQFTQGLSSQQFMPQPQSNAPNQSSGNAIPGQFRGPGGCISMSSCITYCTSHPADTECQKYSNIFPQK